MTGAGVEGGVEYLVVLRRRRGRPVLFFEEGGSTVAAAGLRWEELLGYMGRMGLEPVEAGRLQAWRAGSQASFMEALVFYAVAQTVRSFAKAKKLWDIVSGLELLELRCWASKLSEGYRRRGRLGMYRPARAFKVLYGLA